MQEKEQAGILFPMLKQFLLKKAVQSQLGKVPPEQRAMIEKIMNEKPELLMQLATEVQELMAAGKSQDEAMLAIAKKYEGDLKGLLK